ncbi:hypothetical protein AALP_AAs59725U000100, partial [Arabis alpina]
MILRKEKS